MEEEKTIDDINEKIKNLEKAQIGLETRFVRIIKNIYTHAISNPNEENFIESVSAFLNYFFRRQIIVLITSITAGILALSTLIVTIWSNNLLAEQNDKIDYQNAKITQQNQLLEADRRSSLVFLFNNVMDALDRELSNKAIDSSRILKRGNLYGNISKQLAGRIIALSKRLLPYRMYDYKTDSLSELTSPERGQLLINILEADLNKTTLAYLFLKADFTYAKLDNYRGEDLYLADINLDNSNLESSDFWNSNFRSVSLRNANLNNTQFVTGNLQHTQFTGANLTRASFAHVNLSGSIFNQTILKNALFDNSEFNDSRLIKSDLDSLKVNNCDFDGLIIFESNGDTIVNSNLESLLTKSYVEGIDKIQLNYKIIREVEYRYTYPDDIRFGTVSTSKIKIDSLNEYQTSVKTQYKLIKK